MVNTLNPTLHEVEHIWPSIDSFVFVPHNEAEYDRLVVILNTLLDEVGQDESHPLSSLMEVVGRLIEFYETETDPYFDQ